MKIAYSTRKSKSSEIMIDTDSERHWGQKGTSLHSESESNRGPVRAASALLQSTVLTNWAVKSWFQVEM
eukprot:scaffold47639_cov39-Tisochrysis_lutea.AAC.1